MTGEYDLCNQDELVRVLSVAENVDVAIIDLAQVTFMDSSAIACLVRLRKAMKRNGHGAIVRLINVRHSLARVFSICGLESSFDIQESSQVIPAPGADFAP